MNFEILEAKKLMEMKTIIFWRMILQVGIVQSKACHALITPKFPSDSSCKINRAYVEKRMLPHHFSQ